MLKPEEKAIEANEEINELSNTSPLYKQERSMIDKNKIPKSTYDRLIELMGEDDAEKFIIEENYNFYSISFHIVELELARTIKRIYQYIRKLIGV